MNQRPTEIDPSQRQMAAKAASVKVPIDRMLTGPERRRLEELFLMGDGHASAVFSSNRDMEDFFADEFGVNIYDEKYDLQERSKSKANRLRGFWAAESEYRVGKLILALIQRRAEGRTDRPEDQQQLVEDCEAIAKRLMAGGSVEMTHVKPLDRLSHDYIDEQVEKCKAKLGSGDYSGAITNARTMVETVLRALEEELFAEREEHKGDMQRMYRRVIGQLNLDADQPKLKEPLRHVLRGLFSVVVGLAAVRNSAGDAHARFTKTREHHARIAVNAAMTLTDFLLSTYEYQQNKNASPPSESSGPS